MDDVMEEEGGDGEQKERDKTTVIDIDNSSRNALGRYTR